MANWPPNRPDPGRSHLASIFITEPLNLLHIALAFFLFLWGLALIVPRGQPATLRLTGLVLMAVATQNFFVTFFVSGLYLRFPHMLGVYPPTTFLLGPALYFFARSMADAWRPTPTHLLHFAPVLLAIGAHASVYTLSAGAKLEIMMAWSWRLADFDWRYHFIQVGAFQTWVYHSISLGIMYRSGMRTHIGFLLLVTVIPGGAMMGYGMCFADLRWQEYGVIFLELHLLAYYLLVSRERSWLDRLAPTWRVELGDKTSEADSKSATGNPDAAAASRLAKLDQDEILERLNALMSVEKCYADEDLDIQRLADMLGLKRHQLSELLNHVIGLDFKTYINQFRIQAAQELLLAEPQRSVLSIAFAVGFNSKSAFHQVFRKQSSVTPTEYRQRNANLVS